jgi:hypothetical protein
MNRKWPRSIQQCFLITAILVVIAVIMSCGKSDDFYSFDGIRLGMPIDQLKEATSGRTSGENPDILPQYCNDGKYRNYLHGLMKPTRWGGYVKWAATDQDLGAEIFGISWYYSTSQFNERQQIVDYVLSKFGKPVADFSREPDSVGYIWGDVNGVTRSLTFNLASKRKVIVFQITKDDEQMSEITLRLRDNDLEAKILLGDYYKLR